MTVAHYKGGHHPGNDLGLHYTALPPIVASCPYSDQLLVTRKFWSPGANRPSQANRVLGALGVTAPRLREIRTRRRSNRDSTRRSLSGPSQLSGGTGETGSKASSILRGTSGSNRLCSPTRLPQGRIPRL